MIYTVGESLKSELGVGDGLNSSVSYICLLITPLDACKYVNREMGIELNLKLSTKISCHGHVNM